MRFLLATFFALVAAEEPSDELWKQFKAKHAKDYGAEEQHRFQIFRDNLDMINAHNAKQFSYRMAINKFADLRHEEFVRMRIRGLRLDTKGMFATVPFPDTPASDIATSVDWVQEGAVTSIKDQGLCGSCWAFSAVGAIEGAYFIESGQLTDLSVEELVQCDTYGDQGCDGGLMDTAFQWVKENGITTSTLYPYTSAGGNTGRCTGAALPVVTVTGYTLVPNEAALKSSVSAQPVSVAIEASTYEFQVYGSGVFDSQNCKHELDHGVLIVGYGTDGVDYWKVKNTWGAAWGEDGYIRIARGRSLCGIGDYAVYPVGAKDAVPSLMRRDL